MSQPATQFVIEAPYRSDVVATAAPSLGWRTETDAPDWLQRGAELELTRPSGVETHRVAPRRRPPGRAGPRG